MPTDKSAARTKSRPTHSSELRPPSADISALESAVANGTADAEQHWELARALEQRKDHRGAFKHYSIAARRDPEVHNFAFRTGLMAERLKKHLVAVHWYMIAMSIPDATESHWYFLGRAAVNAQQHAVAAEAFRQYIAHREQRELPVFHHVGGRLSWEQALVYGVLDRPAYAYGLFRSCVLADRLGIATISALELGVAGGRGLLALQTHAATITELTGVEISIHGFDTGTGLPDPQDYRDVPHFFLAGKYAMDQAALLPHLTSAALHIGDAPVVLKSWLKQNHAPIGAVFFDMDHYTPTAQVLEQLGDQSDHRHFLPRIACYFDDVVPKRPKEWLKDYSTSTGERLAIREFNASNSETQISPDYLFRAAPVDAPWQDCCHTIHRHHHPQYDSPVNTPRTDSLKLKIEPSPQS